MRPENPSDRNFFRPQLRLYDPCIRTNVSSSKILVHYAENEHFPPPINRVRTGPGKPGKSWNFVMTFSRTGKSWKKATGPGKFLKFVKLG